MKEGEIDGLLEFMDSEVLLEFMKPEIDKVVESVNWGKFLMDFLIELYRRVWYNVAVGHFGKMKFYKEQLRWIRKLIL